MCSEIEGRDFYNYPKIAIVMTIFFLCLVNPISAQDVSLSIENILEQMVEEGASDSDIELFIDAYKELIINPLDVNCCSRSQLEKLGILSLFQIESLIAYREEFGVINNLTELSLVDGFNREVALMLSPIIIFGNQVLPSQTKVDVGGEVRLRLKRKNENEGFYHSLRASGKINGFTYNFSMESDPQESFADYLSGFLSYKFRKIDATLLIGDYTARFGQGLSVYNSFSFAALGSPSSLLKNKNEISGHRGFDENNYYRGLSFSHKLSDNLDYSLFFSANSLDATSTDSTFSSLVQNGYHRSETEREKKDGVVEFVIGGNLTHSFDRFRVGITTICYRFNKKDLRKIQYYNQFQKYEGWHGNIALNALYSINHFRLFSEMALDAKGHFAVLLGAGCSLSSNFEIFTIVRHYSMRYIARHAGPYSSQNSISNQDGVSVNLLWIPFSNWRISSLADCTYYPSARYNVRVPSLEAKFKVKVEYENKFLKCYLQDSYTFQSHNLLNKHTLKIGSKIAIGDNLNFAVQSDYCCTYSKFTGYQKGLSGSVNFSYSFWKNHLLLYCGLSCCNTDGYNTRLYVYERDLPQSFSSKVLFGKEISYYGVINLKKLNFMGMRINLACKLARTKDLLTEQVVLDLKSELKIDF